MTDFGKIYFPLSNSDKNPIFELSGYRRVWIWNFRLKIPNSFRDIYFGTSPIFEEKILIIFQNVEIFENFKIFLKFLWLWRIFDQNKSLHEKKSVIFHWSWSFFEKFSPAAQKPPLFLIGANFLPPNRSVTQLWIICIYTTRVDLWDNKTKTNLILFMIVSMSMNTFRKYECECEEGWVKSLRSTWEFDFECECECRY